MNRFFYASCLAFSLLFLASCGSKDAVEVTSFSPDGEVNSLTTFTVEFNKELAPAEKQDEWLDDQFIDFEPSIQGKFKWVSPSSLLFSPSQPLKPGQDYTARINKKVLFDTPFKGDFGSFTFHTAYFDVTGIDFFWTQVPRSEYKVTVQANLKFNYPVDPKQLSSFLEVQKEGKKVKNFEILTQEASNTIAINFGEVQQTEASQNFNITIKKGLKSDASPRELSENRSFSEKLPPLTRLAITSVSSGFDGTKGWIQVYTTQEVDAKKLARYVKVDPDRKLKFSSGQNYFRMEAAFDPGSMVDITVKKGLPGMYGGKVEDDYVQTVVMADLAPKLTFENKQGHYLMRGGLENVKVTAVNVKKAKVNFYEVFDNNLVFYLERSNGYFSDYCCGVPGGVNYGRSMSSTSEYYAEEEYYDDYYYYGSSTPGNFGRMLHSEELVLSQDQNQVQNFTLNLHDHLDERFTGVYCIEVRDNEDYWRKDFKLIAVSDLGIIAKRSRNELMVFVNSIASSQPVEGVEVALISTNNQTLVKGTTDSRGIIHIKDLKSKAAGFTPRMVTARKGKDFNFVDFKDSGIELSRYDVGGKVEYSTDYDTYVYAERNLYRPGEKAHFNTIVRDKSIQAVKELPLFFKVTTPRGRTFLEQKMNTNSEGACELEVSLPDFSETGSYTLGVYNGSDKGEMIATYNFSVEEFVPDKIRVRAEERKRGDKNVKPGDVVNIDIFSEYLFGAPAADHNYEVDFKLSHKAFRSKKYSNYNFYSQNVTQSSLENDLVTGKLDQDGKDVLDYPAPEDMVTKGFIGVTGYVTVFDATGRTVTRTVNFNVHPNDYFVGIRTGSYYFGVNKAINFSLAAVNDNDEPMKNFPVDVELVRWEWKTVLKKNSSGAFYYQSERQAVSVKKEKKTINGSAISYSTSVDRSGSYELRVYKRGDERYTSRSFYAYGSGSSTASSFQVDREGNIEIVADKDDYQPGETAKLLFTTPFSGKMLVTVERDDVMDHFYLDVANNSAELAVPVTGKHLPNFFVSATLFKPHAQESRSPFMVGHGYAAIKVDQPSNKLKLEIQAPPRIKPRRTQEIVIKSNPEENIQVTLAMVDEGILQIKNFKTPDPYAYMYAKRKLSVSSYDLYEMLLEEVPALASTPAGGEMSGRRVNPITAKRFKLLSFWSGIRKTNSKGEVRIQVPVPQFNGSARLMAVAWSGERFGSAEKDMIITDDVVVLPSIPRFMAPQDSIALPVTFMNTTNKQGELAVTVKVDGPLKVTSAPGKSVRLGSKESKNLKFGLKAENEVGKAKILIQTTGLDKVVEEIEIAIRPNSPLVQEDDAGVIKAGESKTITIPSDFINGTQETSLALGKFPGLKYAGNLNYLVKYPHGCLEQTTSKLFPQLYVEELMKTISPNSFVNGSPVYFIKEGIRKLQSMQMSDGSLAYWPGGGYTNWWGSTYAAHFLVEAKKKGYKVSDYVLNRLLGYLKREASRKATYSYYTYSGPGQRSSKIMAKKEVLYSLYVLALAEQGDLSLMNYYRARRHLLSGDSRYLLAGAFGLMNKWNAFREVLPEAFLEESPERESGERFDSPVRANAIMLSVLTDVDPTNKQIPSIVRYLTSKKVRAYSTQDKSWLFLALGKAASQNAGSKVTVEVKAGGKVIGTYKNADLSLRNGALNGATVTLKASGKGSVYYFWATEGIKKDPDAQIKLVDKNLSVRRTFYDRAGRKMSSLSFTEGDLVVVEVSLKTGLRGVDNLAISDLIPAGFEIENPRLGTSSSLSWIKRTLYPQYMDIRDDRLVLFTSLPASTDKKFYYMMRAVNAGRFRMAPIGAEAMYDPDFYSYNGPGVVEISRKR